MRTLIPSGALAHVPWRVLLLLVMAGLLLLGPSQRLWAAGPGPEQAGPTPPGAARADVLLRCYSLHPKAIVRAGDCHSAPIVFKTAFYERALKVRLRSQGPGPSEEPLPRLSTHLLLYRKALPLPIKGEGHYQWSYRGLLLWSLDHPVTGRPLVGGYYDMDSGRRFEGGRRGGPQPSRLRTTILQPLARGLPERVYPYIKGLWSQARFEAPSKGLHITLHVAPAAEKAPPGACAEPFGEPGARQSLSETAAALAAALAGAPELAGAPGPWAATLTLCPQGRAELQMGLAGKGLRSQSACPLEEPLTLSAPAGIIAQCALKLANELRTDLVRQYLSASQGVGAAGR